MPEIAEVARIVHFLRKSLIGKTLAVVNAPDDANVFGKVGCSGPAFEMALTGNKVVDAGQQGKYFWLQMEKAPHPLMHFGMTGWIHIKDQDTFYYKRDDTKEVEADPQWPPRFWKFTLETKEEPKVHVAFTDSRRFARIRLIDCDKNIRNVSPLKENGPDPVIDREIFTEEWLEALMKKKHVPVKALLLDQANISGIGNWVGDEIMYHAKLHPEQYSNTFSSAQLKQLHTSILHICQTAVDVLSDSTKFPEGWLFKHRWGKGKKDAPKQLPTGEKITHLTVGGRTSCIVPSLQKKTGAVAGDVQDATEDEETETKADDEDGSENEEEVEEKPKASAGKGRRSKQSEDARQASNGTKADAVEQSKKSIERNAKTAGKRAPGKMAKGAEKTEDGVEKPVANIGAKRKRTAHKDEESAAKKEKPNAAKSKAVKAEPKAPVEGRRRSGRLQR